VNVEELFDPYYEGDDDQFTHRSEECDEKNHGACQGFDLDTTQICECVCHEPFETEKVIGK